jgi:acyl carrier protein
MTSGSAVPALRRERLQQTAPEDRRRLLEDHVGRVVAARLGVDAAALDTRRPFAALGLDSLMVLDVRNRLAIELGVTLSPRAFIEQPTVTDLAGEILRRLSEPAAAAADAGALADDDVDAQLRTLLAEERRA